MSLSKSDTLARELDALIGHPAASSFQIHWLRVGIPKPRDNFHYWEKFEANTKHVGTLKRRQGHREGNSPEQEEHCVSSRNRD